MWSWSNFSLFFFLRGVGIFELMFLSHFWTNQRNFCVDRKFPELSKINPNYITFKSNLRLILGFHRSHFIFKRFEGSIEVKQALENLVSCSNMSVMELHETAYMLFFSKLIELHTSCSKHLSFLQKVVKETLRNFRKV